MRIARSRPAIAVLLALALSVAACAESAPSADAGSPETAASDLSPSAAVEATVAIDTFAFAPEVLVITAGTTVTWTNGDRIDHTVTSGVPGDPDGLFEGALPDEGATFSYTFDAPGTYPYFCAIHPHMTGTVRVTG